MRSESLSDMLDALPSATEGMDVVRDPGMSAPPAPEPEPPEPTAGDIGEERDRGNDLEPEPASEPEHEGPDTAQRGRARGADGARRGGRSGGDSPSSAGSPVVADPQEHPLPEPGDEPVDTSLSDQAGTAPAPDREDDTKVSLLDHTDQQDAIQAETTGIRGGGDAGGGPALSRTGFALKNEGERPVIRALPSELNIKLRSDLRRAAVRELGVAETQAREFSEGLSQAALVVAFLSAQLDVDLETDPTTEQATRLFQSRDPLLGSLINRLAAVERVGHATEGRLLRVQKGLTKIAQQADVSELAMSWLIAERGGAGVARGAGGVDDVEVTHKEALRMRERAREATTRQRQAEQAQEGRPWR